MNTKVIEDTHNILFGGSSAEDSAWLQTCRISMSCLGDALVMAANHKLVILSKNSQGVFTPREINRSCNKGDKVMAALCLPIVDNSSKCHMTWTCFVVGYRSGLVEVMTENGEILLRRQFLDRPVLQLRSSTVKPSWPRCKTTEVLNASSINDVIVVYDKSLVLISGQTLYRTLYLHKGKLAEATAHGENIEEMLQNFPCRKYHVRDQQVNDACVVEQPNVSFDQMAQLSMSQKINANHLKSLGTLAHFITIGSNPFVQYNLPYNVQHQDINELAENVVSTVKSGIFRVASGMLWGTSDTNAKEETTPKDPEQKLILDHAIKDIQKTGQALEKSPNNQYLAVVDNQNRILALEAASGILVNIWKGYHHVQIGWITVKSGDPLKDIDDKISRDSKVCVLLVIYLPRRGIIEVWSVERKLKICEFAVSKFGTLVACHNGVLEQTGVTNLVRMAETCFLDPEAGNLQQIVIPFRCVIDKTSSSHDMLQHQKLMEVLNKCQGPERVKEISEIISNSKTNMSKVSMLIDVAVFENVAVEDLKTVLENCKQSLQKEHEQNQSWRQALSCVYTIIKICRLLDILNVTDFKNKDKDDFPVSDGDDNEVNFLSLSSENSTEISSSPVNLKLLVKWFDIQPSTFENETVRINLTSLSNKDGLGIYEVLVKASVSNGLELGLQLEDMAIFCPELVDFIFQTSCISSKDIVKSLFPHLNKMFKVLHDQMKPYDLYDHFRKLYHSSPMSPQLYFILVQWKDFLKTKAEAAQYLTELTSALHLLEAFLTIRVALQRLSNSREHRNPSRLRLEEYSFQKIFKSGNGKIPEILADCLVKLRVTVDELEEDAEVKAFINTCSILFPKSVQDETLLSHLSWEFFHQWNKQRMKMDYLTNGLLSTKRLLKISTTLTNKLATLIWKTFFEAIVRESVNVTEIRSKSRCLREIGVNDDDLKHVLVVCVGVARTIVDSDYGGSEEADSKKRNYYDDFSLASGQTNLMDHLASNSEQTTTDNEKISFQYQFALVTCLIQSFQLQKTFKPLALFSNQESNTFFQSDFNPSSSSNMSLFSITKDHGIRSQRRLFLKMSAKNVVLCICRLPDREGAEQLDTEEYKEWVSNIGMLSKMWFMPDIWREALVLSLYTEGYDSLGEEMIGALTDRSEIGAELVNIAMMRMTKFIYESPDHNQKMAAINPILMERLSLLQGQAIELNEVQLEDTKKLLVFLCSMTLGEREMQLAYDCLSLVQSYLKKK